MHIEIKLLWDYMDCSLMEKNEELTPQTIGSIQVQIPKTFNNVIYSKLTNNIEKLKANS